MGDSIPESVPPAPIVVVVAVGRTDAAAVAERDVATSAAAMACALGSVDVTVIASDASIGPSGTAKRVDEVDVRLVDGAAATWPAVLADLMRSVDRPIVVADSDSVIAATLARSVAAAGSTSVIVAASSGCDVVGAVAGVPVDVDRGFVDHPVEPSSAMSLAMSWFVVAAGDAGAVASVLDTVPAGHARRASEVLVPSILRAGVALRAVPPRHHPIGSATDEAAAVALEGALEGVDIDASRITHAVKAADGPFTTYCVSPYSRFIAAFGARRGWTPNAVTAFSLVLGLIAALCFLGDGLGILALGALLLISSFVFDCVDGQLARLTLNFSSRGAWLDLYSDRVKEFAMIAALAVGAGSSPSSWMLAGLTVAALSVRHAANATFTTNELAVLLRRRSLAEPAPVVAIASVARPDQRPAKRRRGLRYWLPWILRFTIGDRLFVVSCALLIGGQRWALVALAVGSVFAMVSQIGLRVLRTRRFATEPFVPQAPARVLNDFGVTDRWRHVANRPAMVARPVVASGSVVVTGGLVAAAIALDAPIVALVAVAALMPAVLYAAGAAGGAWWLVPTSSRLVDVLVFLALIDVVSTPWLGVCCLMIVALRHSDLTFRSPSTFAGAGASTWGTSGGLLVRLLVVVAALALDRPIAGLWVIVAVTAVQTVVDVATQLRWAERPDVTSD